jgi:hypothetical protein
MKRKHVSRDEFISHRNSVTTPQQRKKIIEAIIKIIIGIILIAFGYFLPNISLPK